MHTDLALTSYDRPEPKTAAEVLERAKEVARRRQAMRRPIPIPQKDASSEIEQAPAKSPVKNGDKFRIIEKNQHVIDYYTFIHGQKVLALYKKIVDTTEKTPVAEIIKQTAAASGLRVGDIMGPRRDRTIVAARHMAMARAYVERPDLTLPELGRLFKRDHTVLLHAARKMGVWRGADPKETKRISHLRTHHWRVYDEGKATS